MWQADISIYLSLSIYIYCETVTTISINNEISLCITLGFPCGSDGEESACSVGDLCLIPELGRSPGGGHGSALQCSHLENPRGQRSLMGYSSWGCKESDTTERLSTAQHMHYFISPPPFCCCFYSEDVKALLPLQLSSIQYTIVNDSHHIEG